MTVSYYYPGFTASVYGSGVYDSSSYNGNATTTTTSTGSGGLLSNTGIMVTGIVTLAAIILLIALVVRVWKRPGRDDTSN